MSIKCHELSNISFTMPMIHYCFWTKDIHEIVKQFLNTFLIYVISLWIIRLCLHEISFRVKRNSVYTKYAKTNLIFGDKYHVNTTSKWNHSEGKICKCGYFIKTEIQKEIYFISPVAKGNVNKIFFLMEWNFVSGLM